MYDRRRRLGISVDNNRKLHAIVSGLNRWQLKFSRKLMRNYGNMSSPTVMFVPQEVVSNRGPRPGDWGLMTALGLGMAAEAALLRW